MLSDHCDEGNGAAVAQGHAYISTDSAGHSGTIPAVPAMQRLSDQSAHAPSPTKLLSEGREASNAPDYVAPQVRCSAGASRHGSEQHVV